MIVSFSGIDSAGKSTQIDMLSAYCFHQTIKAKKVWGKARGTPGVIFLKSLVRHDHNMSLDEKLDYREKIYSSSTKKKLLLFASLLDLCWYFGIYYRVLNIFHEILICDRYIWDTYVEVKTEFPDIAIDNWLLWKLVVMLSPKPAISFVFFIPANESIRRDIQKQDLTVDSLEIKKRKIALYLNLARENYWTNVIDGLTPIDQIHNEILAVLRLEN